MSRFGWYVDLTSPATHIRLAADPSDPKVNTHLVHDDSNIQSCYDTFPSDYAIRRVRALHRLMTVAEPAPNEDDVMFIGG